MIIETRKEFPDFVAFVSDVDLKNELETDQVKELDTAINKFSVLVFKNQNINDEQQVRFTTYFGEIEASGNKSNITKAKDRRLSTDLADVSNLDKNNKPFTQNDPRRIFNLGNRLWHTDSCSDSSMHLCMHTGLTGVVNCTSDTCPSSWSQNKTSSILRRQLGIRGFQVPISLACSLSLTSAQYSQEHDYLSVGDFKIMPFK